MAQPVEKHLVFSKQPGEEKKSREANEQKMYRCLLAEKTAKREPMPLRLVRVGGPIPVF
jgi:hypothetical protein